MTTPTPPGQEHTPVLIAGAGPVGTVLAMDLARLGIRSVLLDRRRGVPPNPKCNTTNARSMELLRRLGCADAVRDAGLPADHNTDVVYMTRLNGTEIARYERSTPSDVRGGTQHGVAADWPTPEPQHFISQIFLEPVLRATAIERWDVDIREGWELVGFDQEADGDVTASIRDVDTAEQRTIRARYLVGTDGASSDVRRAIGARLEGIDRLNEMCSTYFRSRRVSEIAENAPGWMLRFMAGRAILVAIDGHDGWLIHINVPDGEDPATWDPEAAMFAAIGEPFDYEILDQSRWTPRAMVADRWRDGSVFLAGDAAHLWVPMGGFGMNAGIADAISLSWRLAAAIEGWGGETLLDSYQTQRAPIGGAIANQAVMWALSAGIHMTGDDDRVAELESNEPDGAAAREEVADGLRRDTLSEFECPGFQLGYVYEDSPVIVTDELSPPAATAVDTYTPTSWPGSRLPHVTLADGTPIFDRLGSGFTLIRVGGDAPSADGLVEAARRAGTPLEVVDVDAADVAGEWDDIPLLLVRPDQHVAWRSRRDLGVEAAQEVLTAVTGTTAG